VTRALLVPVIAAASFAAVGLLAALGFITRHGPVRVTWRLMTGQHLDGQARTNRGWLVPGTRPHEALVHRRVSWLARQPRLHRAAAFWAVLTTAALAALGAITGPMLAAAAALTLVYLLGRAGRWLANRAHRRHVINPAAAALAANLGWSPAVVAQRLAITRRHADATAGQQMAALALPDHWPGSEPDRAWVEGVLAARVPTPLAFHWDLTTHPGRMAAYAAAAPPALAPLDEWATEADTLGPGRYLLGAGPNGLPIVWDSDEADPMAAVNGSTRRGKTNLLLGVAAQALRRGERVTYVDPKRVSAACLAGVPGFTLANDPGDVPAMWQPIAAVRQRMDNAARRWALDPSQPPATREVLILDEANQLHALFRDHWETIKAPGQRLSDLPAWADCRAILHQGAQFGFRLIVAGQDIKDAVLFGARASFGTIVLCTWTPAQWQRLTSLRPVPDMPTRRGRFTAARGMDDALPFQALIAHPRGGYANETAWREWALDGRQPTTEPARPPWRGFTAHRPALPWRTTPAAVPAVIIGNPEAARYLGMRTDAFERARRRQPIPGEFTTDIRRPGRPQPCWRRTDLDAWQAARPIAGTRADR
jgi:hypothetical protein